MLWILLEAQKRAESKKGTQWGTACVLSFSTTGTEDPSGHMGSELELKSHCCMSQPQSFGVILSSPVWCHSLGSSSEDTSVAGSRKHTACSRSQWHLEQPSFAKGFLTGLWQVWEKRSAQFSTVPLSKTASSLCVFRGKQAVQVFQGEEGGYEMV